MHLPADLVAQDSQFEQPVPSKKAPISIQSLITFLSAIRRLACILRSTRTRIESESRRTNFWFKGPWQGGYWFVGSTLQILAGARHAQPGRAGYKRVLQRRSVGAPLSGQA